MVTVRAFGQILTLPGREAELRPPIGSSSGCVRRSCTCTAPVPRSPEGRNTVSGVITDASFFGVSTQYLVATPWGQELIAFEQNMSAGDRPAVGETVEMSWEPSHSFGFDGGDNLNAGIDEDLLEVGHYTAADAEAGRRPDAGRGGLIDADPRLGKCGRHLPERDAEPDLPAVASPAKGLRSSRATPYWLLLPGMAWLTIFFVIPLVSLFSTSLQSPVSDNPDDGYYFNWDFANYSEALSRYGEQFLRSFVYAGTATLLALADRLPAGLLHRLQGRAGTRRCCWSWSSRRSSPPS